MFRSIVHDWFTISNHSISEYSKYSCNVFALFAFYRAWFYCKACHDDIKDETLIKKCKCKNCKYLSFHRHICHFTINRPESYFTKYIYKCVFTQNSPSEIYNYSLHQHCWACQQYTDTPSTKWIQFCSIPARVAETYVPNQRLCSSSSRKS